MKVYVSVILSVVVCTFFNLNCAFSETHADSHTKYDIVQRVHDFIQIFRTSQKLKSNEFIVKSNGDMQTSNSDLFSNLVNILDNDYASSSCTRDLLYVAQSINTTDFMHSWVSQMLDSFGKSESGILFQNVKWLGDFDECRNVYAPKQNTSKAGGFHGKYCSLQVEKQSLIPLPLTIGICVPETCRSSDFMHKYLNISNIYPELGSDFKVDSLNCKDNKRELSNAAIATICVMSIFILFVVLGSSITAAKHFTTSKSDNVSVSETESINDDQNKTQYDKDEPLILIEGSRTKLSVFVEGCESFLNCFCIFTNGAKLLNVDATEGQLMCLHGIRFLSMSWVIVCHTYMTPITLIKSYSNIGNQVDNLPFQVILNGWYSVDSFFLLSGFLLAYLYFQEAAKRKGKIPWLHFYIHRYIRLTPVYMIVLAFSATIFPYLGSGPFWPDFNIDPNCQKSWWWNLLYINNFKSSADMCMGWSWYLANDMQFFVFSPIFLISLWRWPKIGYTLLGLFLCANWITSFYITYHYDLIAGGLGNIKQIAMEPTYAVKWDSYMNKIYFKPYTRDAPYLIGIALGYILFKRKITNFKVNRVTLWVGWLVAIPLGLVCVYGLYHQNLSLLTASFFNAFTRTSYSISLSWVIFVCLTGLGGPVNKILSYKLFIPLSRLTYCAYLIHLIILQVYSSSMKYTFMFSHTTVVTTFLGIILITYGLSLLVSLIFESPLIRLEKLVMSKIRS